MGVPVELETALMVVSNSPESVTHDLVTIPGLAGFTLLDPVPHQIRDTYFDVRKRTLQAKRIAFRVREVDGETLLTVKAAVSATTERGRLELEAPWSPDALRRAVAELRSRGVSVTEHEDARRSSDPFQVLASMGFEPVQVRQTVRTTRWVVPSADPDAQPVAELAIDRVTYRFPLQDACLHEIEVEAKHAGSAEMVDRIIRSLLDVNSALRPWPYSKIATGKAIEALLEAGRLDDLLDEGNSLNVEALRRIEAFLDQQV